MKEIDAYTHDRWSRLYVSTDTNIWFLYFYQRLQHKTNRLIAATLLLALHNTDIFECIVQLTSFEWPISACTSAGIRRVFKLMSAIRIIIDMGQQYMKSSTVLFIGNFIFYDVLTAMRQINRKRQHRNDVYYILLMQFPENYFNFAL